MCSRVLSVRMFHFRKRPGWPLVVACKLLLTGGVCPPQDTIYTMRRVNRFPSVGLWIRYGTAGVQPAAVGLYNIGSNQTKRSLGPAGKNFFFRQSCSCLPRSQHIIHVLVCSPRGGYTTYAFETFTQSDPVCMSTHFMADRLFFGCLSRGRDKRSEGTFVRGVAKSEPLSGNHI